MLEDGGAGAHLSPATRKNLHYGWRRWLGFLAESYPGELYMEAADRIRPVRLRDYIDQIAEEVSPSSVAIYVAQLYGCAGLIAPDRDWAWLKSLRSRLQARARPVDRFERLVPGELTLDLGVALMDEARGKAPDPWRRREVQYRDGLILAILSLWPIRRRSLAALTVTRHLLMEENRAELRLFPEDTKSKRPESWPVPDVLMPYLMRYFGEIRPALVRAPDQGALWPPLKGGSLRGGQIYSMARRRTAEEFGSAMGLHDFRRAAATFLAMEAPEKVGLTPGILQHASPEIGDRYYNLARSIKASRRHGGTIRGDPGSAPVELIG